MSLKAGLVTLGAIFLLLAGLKLDGLPYIRQDARYSDSVLTHWPNALFLSESVWVRHEFPVWRETTMAGQPFAANPLNKTAYPLQWLALILQPAVHLNLMIMLHLFLAGAGMWCWMRTLNMRREAVVLATVAYVFAPRMMGHLAAGHLDIVYALAWLPWLMWSVRQLFVQSNGGWRLGLQFGMIAAFILLADMRVSVFALVSAAFYGAICSDLRMSRLVMQSSLVGIIVCLILVAALFIPLVSWQPFMSRSGMTVADAGALSLDSGQLIGLLLPANHSDIESLTYLGLPVLVLAVMGLLSRTRRQVIFGWFVVLIVVLYALGTNGILWPSLATIFPPLRWFRVPSRVWLILVLLTPVMAGYGLQWLLNRLDDVGRNGVFGRIARFRLLTVSWMTLSGLLGVFALVALPRPITGFVVLVAGISVGALLLSGVSRRLSPKWLAILLVTVTCVDLFVSGYQWLSWRSEDFWLTPYKPLAERLVQAGADRIYSPTFSLEQQVAEAYGLHLFGGVDPFQLSGVVRAVEQGSGVPITNYEVVLPPLTGIKSDEDISQANRKAVIDTEVLGKWHVSHVVVAYAIDNLRLKLLDRVGNVYIYANLDYESSQTGGAIPNWPTNWPELPNSDTVKQINQMTILVALFSGLAWIVSIGIYVYLLRSKSDG